jgi:hypothetical protein
VTSNNDCSLWVKSLKSLKIREDISRESVIRLIESSVDLTVCATWIVKLNEISIRKEVNHVVSASETSNDIVGLRVVSHYSSGLSNMILNDLEIL